MHKILFLTLILFAFPFVLHAANDASLYLSPVTGSFTVGEEVPIKVLVGTGDLSINAIEGKITFDPSLMSVERVDKNNSVLQSWTISPSQNNNTGEVVFAGLTSTSSFLGARGEIMTLYVKGKRSEEVSVRFGSGSAAHAGDGTGNNLLSQMNSGLFRFVPKENIPDASLLPKEAAGSSGAVDVGAVDGINSSAGQITGGEVLGAATGTSIVSPTHPDQDKWYATKDAEFQLLAASSTRSILLAFNADSKALGTKSYPLSTLVRKIPDNKDGIWYLHFTEISDSGQSTSHYKIQIDTVPPPQFEIKEQERDQTDPNILILVNATDTLSGVDRVEFRLDGATPVSWRDDGTHIYKLFVSAHGAHKLVATAYDRAGNTRETETSFLVQPIESPVIKPFSRKYHEGEMLTVEATTVPNGTFTVTLLREGIDPISETTQADQSGNVVHQMSYILEPGTYEVGAKVVNAKGGTSKETDTATLDVSSTFLGVLKRHPFIPIVAILFVLLCGIVWFMLTRRGGGDDGDVNESPQSPTQKRVVSTPVSSVRSVEASRDAHHEHAQVSGHIVSLK